MAERFNSNGFHNNGEYVNGENTNGLRRKATNGFENGNVRPTADITNPNLSRLFNDNQDATLNGTPQYVSNNRNGKVTSPLGNSQNQNNPSQIVLRGSLAAFSPSSLLSLLNIQKQSGALNLYSGQASGYIFIEKGEVWDARLDENINGALALFQLFGWKTGQFSFEVGLPTPARRTIEASLPVLQVRATLWLDNFSKYNPIIPTTSHRIGIADEPRSEVVIESYHWAVLTRIVPKPMSIAALTAELKQDVMTVTKMAAELVKMGVAVVYPPEG